MNAADASDLAALQGRWRQVRFEENGVVDQADSHGADGAILTIAGDTFHVAVPGGETLIEGRFVLHSSGHPRRIDWIDSIGNDAGKILPAIYLLTPDSFVFAAADADMLRPENFKGGKGITIRGFVRV